MVTECMHDVFNPCVGALLYSGVCVFCGCSWFYKRCQFLNLTGHSLRKLAGGYRAVRDKFVVCGLNDFKVKFGLCACVNV